MPKEGYGEPAARAAIGAARIRAREEKETQSADADPGAPEPTERLSPDRADRAAGGAKVPDAGRGRPPVLPNYEITGLIGEGGMGTVWAAVDRRLKRPVALKVIRGTDQQTTDRFLAEAQAQARIEHENVCRVYETGDGEGQPFIAMQLLQGRSLTEEAAHLSLEEKVLVIRDVADALQAAHRLGIVHRDLKPANVIVERSGARGVRPTVVDFGIARDLEADHVTITGTLLGTPAYMSPEQARGDAKAVDRRSDVYSLGATLYATLAGRPPFAAAGVFDLLKKVVNEDPEPLRALVPNVPGDLVTIVTKCLEKEPARRYPSAAELRDDLTRYLDGEPIRARGASLTYRLARKAKKHRLALGAASVAALAVLGVGLDLVFTRRAAAERVRMAQELGQEAEKIEWIVRAAQQSPIHDVRREQELARQVMRGIEERMGKEGAARAAGLFALGRGTLALGDARRARALLQESWDLGNRSGDEAYALGLALSRLYGEELRDAERLGDERLRAVRRAELRRRYAEPALSYLRLGRSSVTAAPEYAEALIALHEGRAEAAASLAAKAAARFPWLYEAVLLRGDLALEAGRVHRQRAELRLAHASLAEAAELYRQASEVGRSATATYEAECSAWAEVIYVQNDEGEDPSEAYRRSLEACGRARTVDPSSAAAWLEASFAEWQWGQHLLDAGKSPVEALQRAIAASQEAQRLRPDWAEAYNYAGIAYGYLGRTAAARGEDPRPPVRLAIANFDKALALDPGFAYAHMTRGLGYLDLARDAARRSEEAGPLFATAIGSLRRALQLSPTWLFPRTSLAAALASRGAWEMKKGTDPSASLEEAIGEWSKVLGAGDADAEAHAGLADVFLQQADHERAEGRSPEGSLRKAVEHLEAAAAGAPKNRAIREKLAAARRRLAS